VPVWVLTVVVVAGVAAAQAAGSDAVARRSASVPGYDHVMVVVEENHGFADVIGNPAAPNLNYLANTFGLATNYFGVSHPSEPNYVALLGGSTFGVGDDNPYYVNKINAASLISQMDAAGVSWKAYLQSLPHPGYQGICYPAKCNGVPDIDPLYVSKHVGITNFTTSLNAADWSRQVPINQLGSDLAANTVPRFSWIIPDECRDMHGDPPYCLDSGSTFSGTSYDPQD
jgi:phospholipase C